MPRRARPRCPPVAPHAEAPAPRIRAEHVEAWAAREQVSLTCPAAELAEQLQALADQVHARMAAPRLPPPSLRLSWAQEGEARAEALLALLGSPDQAAALGAELERDELEAVARLRAKLTEARIKALVSVVTTPGGRPSLGRAEIRSSLASIARRAFRPPVRGARSGRFVAWFFGAVSANNGGRTAPISDRARRDPVEA